MPNFETDLDICGSNLRICSRNRLDAMSRCHSWIEVSVKCVFDETDYVENVALARRIRSDEHRQWTEFKV